jgi:hypothetical protein
MLAMIDSDINDLILDYLTAEGYPTAAEKFSKEANLKPLEQQESVIRRHKIKHDIHLGSIQNAIEAINELNPQVSHILPSSFFVCYDYICFMHHAYSLRVVDEKINHTSVLSMSKTRTNHLFVTSFLNSTLTRRIDTRFEPSTSFCPASATIDRADPRVYRSPR